MENIRSKIMKIFKNHNSLQEYFVKIYDPDSYFLENHKETMGIDEDGGKYIAFRIDVYFNDFFISSRN